MKKTVLEVFKKVNELVDDKSENEAFETFAKIHPIEAYDYNPQRFCEYFRKRIDDDYTDKEVEEFVNEQRT